MKSNMLFTAAMIIIMAAFVGCHDSIKYSNESDFVVEIIDYGKGVKITKYVGDKPNVLIPPLIQNIPVTQIDNEAFRGEKKLFSITIPKSVTYIGNVNFINCSNLVSINVDTQNSAYTSVDGVLYNKNITELITYPEAKTSTVFSILTSVTSIDIWAFSSCTNLTEIIIPDNVTTIGGAAFEGCTNLTSINIPNGVACIAEWTFQLCTKLTSITIPNSITSIGDGSFDFCENLISVTIPNSVTRIGWNAFHNCTSLTSVTFTGKIISSDFNEINSFPGDLRNEYLKEGIGTYTRPTKNSHKWEKIINN